MMPKSKLISLKILNNSVFFFFLIPFVLFLSLDNLHYSSMSSLIRYPEDQNLLLSPFNEFLTFTINEKPLLIPPPDLRKSIIWLSCHL